MSRLAIAWVEKTFNLPSKITSIEKDLSDGNILLKILHQCGHVTDDEYEEILPSSLRNPSNATNNLKLLVKVLKRMDITLSKKEALGIITGK